MGRVTLINISNVNDGETPIISLDELTGDLVIGKDTWRVVSASKFDKLDKAVKGNIQKIELTDEAYKRLVSVVNGNKIELDRKLSEEINDVYASLKGRSQNYSYNSTIEPQGQSNAKPIDEILSLAGESPSSDYHDVYRIWKGQITTSNTWQKVIEKHQGDIFNDMKTGNYYRFVYDEEKGTAFWLKGSNTAVSDLISRLTVEGELITSTKLNEMLAASSEFRQFKQDDTTKKNEIDKKLKDLAEEAKNMGTLVSGHSTNLNNINEFVRNPTINDKAISDMISEANQQAVDAKNEIDEFKETQNVKNTDFIQELNEAKKTSKSDLEAESLRLAEFIKEAQKAGNDALAAIESYSRFNDSNVKKVEDERAELEKKLNEFKESSSLSMKQVSEENKAISRDLATYKDANRRTIAGVEEKVELAKKEAKDGLINVKKDISSITTNIIRKGDMRNGRVINGIGSKVRLEMQVFYGNKDVTQIAHDNSCISWNVNNDDRISLGKIFDIDGSVVMASQDQQVEVSANLDKEHLMALVAPGYNVWIKSNFVYKNNRLISESEENPTIEIALFKDNERIPIENYTASFRMRGPIYSNNDHSNPHDLIKTGKYTADKKLNGMPIIIEGTATHNGQVIGFRSVIEQSGG